MINAKTFFTTIYPQLPPLAQTVFSRDGFRGANGRLADDFQLSHPQVQALLANEISLIGQEFPPSALRSHLEQDLRLDSETAAKLTHHVLGLIALPLEWHLGNVQSLIRDLGGNVDEYLAEAKKTYPEVYAPTRPTTAPPAQPAQPVQSAELPAAAPVATEHPIFKNFDERVGSVKGRAEVLLRLTGLSAEVEAAIKTGRLIRAEGEGLLQQLDGLGYAVNTKDLNALEVEALKRGIKKVLRRLAKTG